jgi:hypothetical protein
MTKSNLRVKQDVDQLTSYNLKDLNTAYAGVVRNIAGKICELIEKKAKEGDVKFFRLDLQKLYDFEFSRLFKQLDPIVSRHIGRTEDYFDLLSRTPRLYGSLKYDLKLRVSAQFARYYNAMLIHAKLQSGDALAFGDNVFVLNYTPPNSKGKLSVVHFCPKRERWVHRRALRLRCNACGAKIDKKKKMIAALKFRVNV